MYLRFIKYECRVRTRHDYNLQTCTYSFYGTWIYKYGYFLMMAELFWTSKSQLLFTFSLTSSYSYSSEDMSLKLQERC